MTGPLIVDAGPLVVLLAENSKIRPWVTEQFKRLKPPFLTCEPVLTEAAFLLKRHGADPDHLFAMIERGALEVNFKLGDHIADVRELVRKYQDTPMSLADACLVRMAEIHQGSTVFTLDADFLVYRKRGRQVIPVLMPTP